MYKYYFMDLSIALGAKVKIFGLVDFEAKEFYFDTEFVPVDRLPHVVAVVEDEADA